MSADAGVGGIGARSGAGPRTVVVTGASAGLGYFAAEQLAAAGHRVVLAVRSPERGAAAAAAIRARVPGASVELLDLDLADLTSVRAAADRLETLGPVDAVLNNAGVVGAHSLRRTRQGLELQMGTNHIGHFAWTALVLPQLERTSGRVVHVGSIAHTYARLSRRNPLAIGVYVDHYRYAQSKLAVELFGFELAQRLADSGSSVSSVVAHPGFSLDSLTPAREGVTAARDEAAWAKTGQRLWAQGKDAGAAPLVHAAVGDDVESGQYWGPSGVLQLRGGPAVVRALPHAHDRNTAARLWRASEHATDVRFALPAYA
jgi:NAD(P)-dependent dehydrogenase (short-subunit alcohol dehydrogenase family)